MAADSLNQFGRSLRKMRQDIDHSETYVSKNHPLIEEVADIIGTLYTFRFEFKTYDSENVKMNLIIKPKYKQI